MIRRSLVAPLPLLVVALCVGFVFERLFYGQWLGLNLPLFVVALLVGGFVVSRREKIPLRRENLALLIPAVLVVSSFCFFRANSTLLTLNTVFSLFLLSLCAYFWSAGSLFSASPAAFLTALPLTAMHSLFHAFEPLLNGFGRLLKTREGNPLSRSLPILRGILVALPVLLVLGSLLSSADAVFSEYIYRLFTQLLRLDLYADHLLIVFSIAWVVAGGMTFAMTRYENADEKATPLAERRFGFVESLTVLASVCALFIAFIGVQFAYLFGGAERALRVSGLNYADYARKGFWELVMVALLTGGLLIVLRDTTRRADGTAVRWFSALGTLLMGCTLVLLVSAAQRMHAYEMAWGATELRLIVDVFLLWLAAALIWLGVTLWHWSDRLVIGILACAVGCCVHLNVANMDDYVVRRNVTIFHETGRLDTEHLSYLSDDAIPALRDAYRTLNGKEKAAVGAILSEESAIRQRQPVGFGWNLSRFQADAAIRSLSGELPKTAVHAAPLSD